MMNTNTISCDLLVIGAGMAGMTAACRAADLGLKTVQAGSSSGFFLTSGLLDFLGVSLLDSPRRLEHPEDALKGLAKSDPDHPYGKLGSQEIRDAFGYIQDVLKGQGLVYVSRPNHNYNVLTAAGTFKPTYLIPKTMADGTSLFNSTKKALLIDFNGMKGYCAKQIKPNLERMGHSVETLSVDVPELKGDFNVQRLAKLFNNKPFLENLAGRMRRFSSAVDIAGLPAVCGIDHSLSVLQKISELSGIPCFEIPGLPPSIPGIRIKNAFEKKLSGSSVTLLNNAVVNFKRFEGSRLLLEAVYQNIHTRINTAGVVLATGRFPGGGLQAQREEVLETVFNLPVKQPDQRSLWYHLNLFHPRGHEINRCGISTDQHFRPVGRDGRPVFKSLYAAGANLSDNDWIRLKSGAGVSLASACYAVDHFYAAGGADA